MAVKATRQATAPNVNILLIKICPPNSAYLIRNLDHFNQKMIFVIKILSRYSGAVQKGSDAESVESLIRQN